jgi:hypothetical protein
MPLWAHPARRVATCHAVLTENQTAISVQLNTLIVGVVRESNRRTILSCKNSATLQQGVGLKGISNEIISSCPSYLIGLELRMSLWDNNSFA